MAISRFASARLRSMPVQASGVRMRSQAGNRSDRRKRWRATAQREAEETMVKEEDGGMWYSELTPKKSSAAAFMAPSFWRDDEVSGSAGQCLE